VLDSLHDASTQRLTGGGIPPNASSTPAGSSPGYAKYGAQAEADPGTTQHRANTQQIDGEIAVGLDHLPFRRALSEQACAFA